MNHGNQETISTLHELAEACRDCRQEFRNGAEDVGDEELRSLFRQRCLEREKLIGDLEMEMQSLGEQIDDARSTSVGGSIGRGILEVKSAVLASNTSTILGECEAVESSAIDAYRRALEQSLPDETRALLLRQYSVIEHSHEALRELCRRYDQ